MRIIVLIVLAVMVSGCASQVKTRTIFQEVKVPVPCSPKLPDAPPSAVDQLPLDAGIDAQMRALRADRIRSKAYTEQLEAALSSCL